MSNGSGDRRLSEFLDRMIANGDTVYAGVEDWYGTPIVEGEGHYYQWDKNQKLLVLIPDSWTPQLSYRMYSPTGSFTEVQAAEAAFGYPNQEVYRRDPAPKALGRLITAMNKHWLEFEVPNKALEKSGEMWAYITVTSEHHTMTEFIVKIMVLPRVKPEPYQSLNDPDSVAQVLAMLIEARDRAEAAANRSEAAADRSEAAQAAAEAARDSAIAAKNAAEIAQGKAEQAQTKAETAQGKAEDARDRAKDYRDEAEGFRNSAESYRNQAKSYYDNLVNAGTTIDAVETRVKTLEDCCDDVKDYIPPPFTLAINGSTYGYKDTGGSFHPFKHPSGTLTLTANTGSSGVNTEYGSDGAYYEKVVVDVPEGPGPTVHTDTYGEAQGLEPNAVSDMGASHSYRYVDTNEYYKRIRSNLEITSNGVHSTRIRDNQFYENVEVNVPSSGSTGYALSGTKEVTANGEYNVAKDSSNAYEKFKVNVESDITKYPFVWDTGSGCIASVMVVQAGTKDSNDIRYAKHNITDKGTYVASATAPESVGESPFIPWDIRKNGTYSQISDTNALDCFYIPQVVGVFLAKYFPGVIVATTSWYNSNQNGYRTLPRTFAQSLRKWYMKIATSNGLETDPDKWNSLTFSGYPIYLSLQNIKVCSKNSHPNWGEMYTFRYLNDTYGYTYTSAGSFCCHSLINNTYGPGGSSMSFGQEIFSTTIEDDGTRWGYSAASQTKTPQQFLDELYTSWYNNG